MSLLVLGVTHHDAPLALLEALALDPGGRTRLEERVLASEHVREALVLSTCNRTEVYAETRTFHGAVSDLLDALTEVCGVDRGALQEHLQVHYEDRGAAHAFEVASGLDSMAVGEVQIVGQLRRSLARAQRHGHVGPALNGLFQQALRVSKRVHSETEIDQVAGSLVGAALTEAERVLGPLGGLRVLVVGAGGMGSLAATTAVRAGVGELVVVNRSPERGHSLAERLGGRAHPLSDLQAALDDADIVISSTGAAGWVIAADAVATALEVRGGAPQVYVDLALPHDVEVGVERLDGATRIDLEALGTLLQGRDRAPQVQQARDLVTAEVAEHVLARSEQAVAPTVAALRARAGAIVADELDRLTRRTPGLSEGERAEVARALTRTVDKLLHAPTVRVKALARDGQGGSYAQALGELFDLDPTEVPMVSRTPVLPGEDA